MTERPATPTPWSDAVERVVEAGELLVEEGALDSDVFLVVDGSFEILRGDSRSRIDTVGPGSTIGEIASLAGCPRTATVRAIERSMVRQLDGDTHQQWLAGDPTALQQVVDLARSRIDRQRAVALVSELLFIQPDLAAEVVESSQRVLLAAGDVLFTEGDDSDAGYLVVAGRLAATRRGELIGEIPRGEVVGEIGLIERTPRTATVTAVRDTTLARFDVDAFRAIAAKHPVLMFQLSRTIIARIGRRHAEPDRARSIAVAVTAPLDTRVLVTRLSNEVERHGSTAHLWAAGVDAALGRDGLVEGGLAVTQPALLQYLHETETGHSYLLLEIGDGERRWTDMALALADRIVVVCSARPGPDERQRIEELLGRCRGAVTSSVGWRSSTLPTRSVPTVAQRWPMSTGSTGSPTSDRDRSPDLNRLARLVSGNATALVLGGGGARGFAHLGVWRALRESGVEIDTVGGTSIGAAMGVVMATGTDDAQLVPEVTRLFKGLLDYTVPVVSLIKGERISRNIASFTDGADIRDIWLPFFCVSTNLTRSRVEVHDRGDAATAIRASVAIPGILPPVPFAGELLVDGGVLNNLPCDVMRASGTVRRLIAVDLTPSIGPGATDDFGHSVSGWKALRARAGSGQSQFPGLMSVLVRSLVAGSVRDRDLMVDDGTVDLYLDLDLPGVSLLDFDRVAEIAARGHDAALPRITELLTADEL